MKFGSLLLIPLLILTSCSLTSTPREERHKIEMALHKVRTDIEEVKHDLNTSEIEMHILEGKVIDQESTMTNVKDQIIDSQRSRIDALEERIASLERKINTAEKRQDDVKNDLRKLGSHANETTAALSQYKDKIEEVEQELHKQQKKFQEIAKLKDIIEDLSRELSYQGGFVLKAYQIKDGDSLEKIAKNYNTTVENLKKINRLNTDLIMAGEEIYVPVKSQ